MNAPAPTPDPAAAPRRRWHAARRILLGPALATLALATFGWFVSPVLLLLLSLFLAAVGVPTALLYSVYIVARRRSLPESTWLKQTRHLAILVAFLILLVPANAVPTVGKRRFLRWQGRAAVRALEAHRREHGFYPDRLDDAPGVPWLRAGLDYRSEGTNYEISFEDPGYYFLDSASWRWDPGAGRWKYVFEPF